MYVHICGSIYTGIDTVVDIDVDYIDRWLPLRSKGNFLPFPIVSSVFNVEKHVL